MSKKYLGLDSSTQSMSAIVIDPQTGEVVYSKSINFGERLPQYNSPSGYLKNEDPSVVHSDPLMWLDALDLLFKEMKDEGFDFSEIAGISGSGQQHGSVYLNAKFFDAVKNLDAKSDLKTQFKPLLSRATSPIWMDTSTSKECAEMAEALGGNERLSAITGSGAIERFTGSQIRKFAKTEPESYKNTARIHLVSSFICSVMAGRDSAIDFGDGAGMNMLNLQTLAWDKQILDFLAPDLAQKMPECLKSDTVAGKVSNYFVEKYGFNKDAEVVLFTGDNPSSLVGVGAMADATAAISLGTSDTFFASMSKLATDPAMCGHVFGNPAGGFMSLICFRNGSLAREHLKADLGVDWTFFDKTSFAETPVGDNGNLFVAFYGDEIAPRVNSSKPALKGSADFESGKDKAAQIRALVEGQFMNMKLRSDWMSSKPKKIRLTGGASKSDGMARVASDVFNAKIERMKVGNSAALGAAMRAANGAGKISWQELADKFCKADEDKSVLPIAENVKIYEGCIQNFKKFLQEVYGVNY